MVLLIEAVMYMKRMIIFLSVVFLAACNSNPSKGAGATQTAQFETEVADIVSVYSTAVFEGTNTPTLSLTSSNDTNQAATPSPEGAIPTGSLLMTVTPSSTFTQSSGEQAAKASPTLAPDGDPCGSEPCPTVDPNEGPCGNEPCPTADLSEGPCGSEHCPTVDPSEGPCGSEPCPTVDPNEGPCGSEPCPTVDPNDEGP